VPMKVRILSGNARGQIVEMSQTEAEVNIATGYAQAYVAPPEPKQPAATKSEPKQPKD